MKALDSNSRVLVVVVARIGDTLLVTPALRALRRAAGHLAVLAHPKRTDVLRHLEFIDELGSISKLRAIFANLRAHVSYDLAVCYGKDPALLNYCARRSRAVVCFDFPELRQVGGPKVFRVPPPPDKSVHAVEERLALARAAGVTTSERGLAYKVSPDEMGHAVRWVETHVSNDRCRLVGFQPFSFPTKAHRDWPLESFLELARRLLESFPETHLLLLGDAAAAKRCADFQRILGGRCTVAAGKFSLRQSAALMAQLALYVGVDTGPTHIAGALGIPMVALYHPAYPARNLSPLDRDRCIAIEAPIRDGGFIAGDSMATLMVDDVWPAVYKLLTGRNS